ncbi:MAG: PadR family transcriptional regulator [Thermodesulfobacteriota bacterium]
MVLEHAILAVLSGGPQHGYAVRRELSHALFGIRTVNQGQVYATLERLARDGLVTIDDAGAAGARRTYALTAAGRRRLRRWLDRPTGAQEPRSDLPARLALLASSGDRTGIERLLAEQRARCATVTRLLGRRAQPVADRGGASGDLVARAVLRHVAAELEWLDLVQRELDASDASAMVSICD